MPANIFEIITNKGNEPVITTNFDIALAILNGEMNFWVGQSGTQQTIPAYYTFLGLSNLAQMDATQLPTPPNADLSGNDGAWSFISETRNGIIHSNTFAYLGGWNFKVYSLDNLGVSPSGALLENNPTP